MSAATFNRPALHRLMGRLAARQDLALVALLVMTTVMMILPVPTVFADILISINLGLSILLMMVAIYIGSSVEFSTLPTVILVTTAFRLSLSITTSRMVLVQGDAGDIIRTFGEFVISGNIVVGLVVYLIITVVQFVVITKGSERVAEVAARFTLDALPGKQISIDTDLKNGDIDQKEARRRRSMLEKESQLYGAMDGAMKFVKGDAIASLVIIVVNLVGGMAIGIMQRGMPFADAVQTYSLLAVGDGLIAQIPALLISLTAGIIVTRVASAEGGTLGRDMMEQIVAQPRVLQAASAVLAGLAFVPGFPMPVLLTLAAVLGAGGWATSGRRRKQEMAARADAAASRVGPEPAHLTVRVGSALAAHHGLLGGALEGVRAEVAARLGIRVPRLNLLPAPLEPGGWRFDVDGIPVAGGKADLENADAPGGGKPDEIVRWVAGAVGTALGRSAGQFLGIQEAHVLLTGMEAGYAELVQEALKGAPLPRLAEVLRRLVDEGIPVLNLRAVLECAADWGGREPNTAVLAEHVRAALRRQICHVVADAEKLVTVVLLDGPLDEALRGAIHATPTGVQLVLDPAALDRLASALRSLLEPLQQQGVTPAVLCSTELRRHLRVQLARRNLLIPVLAHGELAPEFQVQVGATLRQSAIAVQPTPHLAQDGPRLAPEAAAA